MFGVTVASFFALMVYSAYSDLRSYTLPNFISVVLVVGFVVVAAVLQPPLSVIGWHIAIAVLMFVIGFAMFAGGLLGGGDVKVIAALGLWFGPSTILPFFVLMAMMGGLVALAILIFRRFRLPKSWQENTTAAALHDRDNGIPYGIAIAIAALVEFPNTEIYQALAQL